MIYLSAKIKYSQLKEYAIICRIFIKAAQDYLPAEEYYHYYNLKSLLKRIFDKQYSAALKKDKLISFRVNINEFNTLRYMYDHQQEQFFSNNMVYYKILIQGILSELDKKAKNFIPEVSN